MKLRFEVDQAACFRRGIDCPKSIVTIEVDPSTLTENERDLIADRLIGIDVCILWNSDAGNTKGVCANGGPDRIKAESPDYAGLIAAVRANEAEVKSRQLRHRGRGIALAIAQSRIDKLSLLRQARNEQTE